MKCWAPHAYSHLLDKLIIISMVFAFFLQAQGIWAESTTTRVPTSGSTDSTPAAQGRTKPDKEPAKKYQWLFKERKAQDAAGGVEQAVITHKLDREIKEARRLYLSGETDNAIVKYRRVIDDFESMLDEIPPGHPLLKQFEERFQVFEELASKVLGPVNVAPREDLAEQIFQLMERRRVCRRKLALKKAGPIEFFDVPKNLLGDERELQNKLLELWAEVPTTGSRQTQEAIRSSLADIRKALEKSSPRYALLSKGSRLGLSDVCQKILGKNEMILDFNLLSDRMVVGMITSEKAVYHQVSVNRAEVDKAVLNLQEMLREFTLQGRSTFMGHAWKEPSRRVYRLLLGKLPALPEEKDTTFIIPDRSLWYLPFSVMLDADDKPFGSDRLISSIASVDALCFLRSSFMKSEQSGYENDLLLLESIPWIASEEIREATSDQPVRKKISEKISEEEKVEKLILNNPVYPRPSEVVIHIQKMFKKFTAWVGPTATFERLMNDKEKKEGVAVIAVPLAVNDSLGIDRPPIFFFSPDKRGQRVLDARMLFSIPMPCQLAVLPVAWFEVRDRESITGEGPLVLCTAMYYSGTRMCLVNYSNPDWGSDEHFLLNTLKKVSEKVPAGKALAGYTREIPSTLGTSFAGRPPSWAGWILMGDPN